VKQSDGGPFRRPHVGSLTRAMVRRFKEEESKDKSYGL